MSVRRFSSPREVIDCLVATLSQSSSSSRGRKYLRAQAAPSLGPPAAHEAFVLFLSHSLLVLPRSPGKLQIPGDFVGQRVWHSEPASPSPYQYRLMATMAALQQLEYQDLTH